MNLRPAVFAATLALCTACPGPNVSDGGTGGGSGGSVPLDQLCVQLSDSLCQLLIRCQAVQDSAGCRATFDPTMCAVQQVTGIDAGRVRYDSVKAAQCLDDVKTTTCEKFSGGDIPSCNETFVGLVPTGSLCGHDMDCVPGDFCLGTGLSCGGTCTARVPVGQTAPSGYQCIEPASPVGDVCTAPIGGAGTPCGNPDGGFDGLPCTAGDYCLGFARPDGGLERICAGNHGVVGGPCRDPDAGIAGCGSFSYCDSATSRCVAPIGVGATCAPLQFGNNPCKFDLWCNTGAAMATCQPISDTGGPCVNGGSCKSGLCDGGVASRDGGRSQLGVCGALPLLGERCLDRCATGYCDFMLGTCQARKDDGQSCRGTDECKSFECNSSDGGSSRTCGICSG